MCYLIQKHVFIYLLNNQKLLTQFNQIDVIEGKSLQCVKSVRIRSFSDLYFPAFELNTKRYSVSLHIQSEFGKTRTIYEYSEYEHFSRSVS